MPVLFLPIAYVVIILSVLFIYLQIKRPKNFPPGPKWLPIVGCSQELRRLSILHSGLHHAFSQLSKLYSTDILGLKLGNTTVVCVQGYRLVRHVLTAPDFEARPDDFFIRLRCLGARRGITCVDGPLWLEQRNFVVRHLKQMGYGKKTMENLVLDEVDEILELLNTSKPVRLEPIFAPSILNILWSFTTSSRLARDDPKLAKFLSVLQIRAKAFDMAGGTLNQFPWLRFFFPERLGYNLLLKINKQLKNFFVQTIQEHYENWYDDCQDDLIYSYITEMKKSGNNNFTEDQLIVICLDVFIAGSHTTSNSIDFIFLMMLLHPDIQEKAAQSFNQFPSNQTLTYNDRLKVPYIEAIIMETERMYPVAPIIGPRRVLNKDTVLDGYHIPQNTTVLVNTYSVHHDVKFWQDPNVFRPERFINDGKLMSGERVVNFGLGKRRCLGELLAKQCIFLFFANVIRKYRICPVPGKPLPSAKAIPGLLLSTEKFEVILEPRS